MEVSHYQLLFLAAEVIHGIRLEYVLACFLRLALTVHIVRRFLRYQVSDFTISPPSCILQSSSRFGSSSSYIVPLNHVHSIGGTINGTK